MRRAEQPHKSRTKQKQDSGVAFRRRYEMWSVKNTEGFKYEFVRVELEFEIVRWLDHWRFYDVPTCDL